jgi:hypothetical protein
VAYKYTRIDGKRVEVNVAVRFIVLRYFFERAFKGITLHVSDGTRTFAEQVAIFLSVFAVKLWPFTGPFNDVRWWKGKRYVRVRGTGTVAQPGTSNHEEDGPRGPRALDIHDSASSPGVTKYGNARSLWIKNNAKRIAQFDPAGYDDFKEPWHIEAIGKVGVALPTVKRGSKNKLAVMAIQILCGAGVDGIWGNETDAKVAAKRKALKLPAGKVCDSAMWSKLLPAF